MLPQAFKDLVPYMLIAQLGFSCTAVIAVTVLREWRGGSLIGAICWGVSYWAKSALIVVAIIYGPEKHHWAASYGIMAAVVFGCGDIGLILLWSAHRE